MIKLSKFSLMMAQFGPWEMSKHVWLPHVLAREMTLLKALMKMTSSKQGLVMIPSLVKVVLTHISIIAVTVMMSSLIMTILMATCCN